MTPAGYQTRGGIILDDGYSVHFAARGWYPTLPPCVADTAALVRWLHEGIEDPIIYLEFSHLGEWLAIGRHRR